MGCTYHSTPFARVSNLVCELGEHTDVSAETAEGRARGPSVLSSLSACRFETIGIDGGGSITRRTLCPGRQVRGRVGKYDANVTQGDEGHDCRWLDVGQLSSALCPLYRVCLPVLVPLAQVLARISGATSDSSHGRFQLLIIVRSEGLMLMCFQGALWLSFYAFT